MSDIRWYVVLSMSGAEWQAHKGLLKKGIRSYLPYHYADVRRGRWYQGAIKPQFRGYLFAGMEPQESVEPIRSTVGIRDILRDNRGLVYLSGAQMQRCQKYCDEEYFKNAPARIERVPLQIGDWVATPSGAFLGAPCQVEAIDKSGFVRASIGHIVVSFHVSAIHGSVRGRLSLGPMAPETRSSNKVNEASTARWKA